MFIFFLGGGGAGHGISKRKMHYFAIKVVVSGYLSALFTGLSWNFHSCFPQSYPTSRLCSHFPWVLLSCGNGYQISINPWIFAFSHSNVLCQSTPLFISVPVYSDLSWSINWTLEAGKICSRPCIRSFFLCHSYNGSFFQLLMQSTCFINKHFLMTLSLLLVPRIHCCCDGTRVNTTVQSWGV